MTVWSYWMPMIDRHKNMLQIAIFGYVETASNRPSLCSLLVTVRVASLMTRLLPLRLLDIAFGLALDAFDRSHLDGEWCGEGGEKGCRGGTPTLSAQAALLWSLLVLPTGASLLRSCMGKSTIHGASFRPKSKIDEGNAHE